MIQTSVTDVNWWASIIIGLLDKGEWKTLIFGLILTYAGTYILNLVYSSFINQPKHNKAHIRLIAITAGFVAAGAVWDNHAISMDWYIAGIMLGPLSIVLHHILLGVVSNPPISKYAPWIYPLLKGAKDKRVYQEILSKEQDRRR